MPADERREVADHLPDCAACREAVEFFQRLAAATAEPLPVPDVTKAVLDRRRSGERIQLVQKPAVLRKVQYGLAASIALAFGLVGYLLFVPTARANRSVLEFDPAVLAPASTVNVSYKPAGLLAGEDSLRLRVRSRTADSPFPRGGPIGELQTATLKPAGGGTYEGKIAVDPDAIYVAAVVEDFQGERVDTNFGRLWDSFVRT